MKSILFILCVLSTHLIADTQIAETYNLPDLSAHWTIGNKIDNEATTTVIFVPKGTTNQTAKEFFGIHINKLDAGNIHDTTSFKNGLAKKFPNMKIDLWELENTNEKLLYEWAGKENGIEKVHGWGHAFKTKQGSVVIGYFTENTSDIQRARNDWLPVIKNARD